MQGKGKLFLSLPSSVPWKAKKVSINNLHLGCALQVRDQQGSVKKGLPCTTNPRPQTLIIGPLQSARQAHQARPLPAPTGGGTQRMEETHRGTWREDRNARRPDRTPTASPTSPPQAPLTSPGPGAAAAAAAAARATIAAAAAAVAAAAVAAAARSILTRSHRAHHWNSAWGTRGCGGR